jgi:hypothetical protein
MDKSKEETLPPPSFNQAIWSEFKQDVVSAIGANIPNAIKAIVGFGVGYVVLDSFGETSALWNLSLGVVIGCATVAIWAVIYALWRVGTAPRRFYHQLRGMVVSRDKTIKLLSQAPPPASVSNNPVKCS